MTERVREILSRYRKQKSAHSNERNLLQKLMNFTEDPSAPSAAGRQSSRRVGSAI